MLTNSQVLAIDDNTTAVALSQLASGTYYVAVTAVYSSGDESWPTDEVMTIIQ